MSEYSKLKKETKTLKKELTAANEARERAEETTRAALAKLAIIEQAIEPMDNI